MKKLFLRWLSFSFLLVIFCSFHPPQEKEQKKVALFIVATNKYIQFVPPLIDSARTHFLKNHDVTFFVFSDRDIEEAADVVHIYQNHIPWPYATLMRFHMYAQLAHYCKVFDYIYAIDADALFVAPVGDEILSESVFTNHPFYLNKEGTYDRNPSSTAYVPPGEGSNYFAGGFYGGTSKAFFNFVTTAKRMVDIDMVNNYIALWHDESYLNRYAIDNPPTLALPPSYCYPEKWKMPFEQIILVLFKDIKEFHQ